MIPPLLLGGPTMGEKLTVQVGRGAKVHAGYRDRDGRLQALCGAGGMNVPFHRRSTISRCEGPVTCSSCLPKPEGA